MSTDSSKHFVRFVEVLVYVIMVNEKCVVRNVGDHPSACTGEINVTVRSVEEMDSVPMVDERLSV